MEDQNFELMATDPITQIPAPVQISTAALREALIKNPSLLVGALHDVLAYRFNPSLATAEAAGIPTGGVALETPITALIGPGDIALLSPAAKKLTRGDLMAMAGWGGVPKKDPASLGLDVRDIQTIREIFGRQLSSEVELQGINVSCCSCCPCCCCAVAVAAPEKALA